MRNVRHGFSSEEQAQDWFGWDGLTLLAECDFSINVYDVDLDVPWVSWATDGKQVVYAYNQATFIETIPWRKLGVYIHEQVKIMGVS